MGMMGMALCAGDCQFLSSPHNQGQRPEPRGGPQKKERAQGFLEHERGRWQERIAGLGRMHIHSLGLCTSRVGREKGSHLYNPLPLHSSKSSTSVFIPPSLPPSLPLCIHHHSPSLSPLPSSLHPAFLSPLPFPAPSACLQLAVVHTSCKLTPFVVVKPQLL
jgi:hypothetical protein